VKVAREVEVGIEDMKNTGCDLTYTIVDLHRMAMLGHYLSGRFLEVVKSSVKISVKISVNLYHFVEPRLVPPWSYRDRINTLYRPIHSCLDGLWPHMADNNLD
jgi:hypothetical protein